MQKLPGAPDRKRAMHMQKGILMGKERNPFSFSNDWWSDNTKIFLVALGGTLSNLSRVAAVSVNIQPKHKKYQMDQSNYKLKTNLPKSV